ncbi:twin-arginine translocation signal domain-containing protein [Streptomyces sp. SM1P]
MDTWTRRKFLTTSGVAGGVALAAGATAWGVDELLATGSGEPDADASVLVLVTLYGGNDGLNTLVPASDPRYRDLRGDLAYAEEEVLPLGEGLGLNPGLGGLKKLWDERRLAVVRGSPIPGPTTATSGRWRSGRPRRPRDRCPPAGWAAGWTTPATVIR